VLALSPTEYGKRIEEETEKWAKVIKSPARSRIDELLRLFDLRKFEPRTEADEGRNEQFHGGLLPTGRLIKLCKR